MIPTVNKLEMNSISQKVVNWIKGGSGPFADTEIYKVLDLFDADQKKMCSDILVRLVKQGEIELTGRGYGRYRRIDRSLSVIDWKSADTTEFPIQLPFHLHEYCRTFSKSIIAISGEKGTGKTSICLNIVRLNQNIVIPVLGGIAPIYYFSSEMLEQEFRVRLQEFTDIPEDDWNFEPINRTENFADVIQPNAINIIDYLEMHDKFWLVAKYITDIWNRLDKGICIICVQKGEGKEHGRGGSFLVEKPRLSINLTKRYAESGERDGSTLKVTNCKFPRKGVGGNPEGKQLDYKIYNGAELSPVGQWYYKQEK